MIEHDARHALVCLDPISMQPSGHTGGLCGFARLSLFGRSKRPVPPSFLFPLASLAPRWTLTFGGVGRSSSGLHHHPGQKIILLSPKLSFVSFWGSAPLLFQALFIEECHYCETSTRTPTYALAPRLVQLLFRTLSFTLAACRALFLPAPSGSASLRPRTRRLGQPFYCALPIATFGGGKCPRFGFSLPGRRKVPSENGGRMPR